MSFMSTFDLGGEDHEGKHDGTHKQPQNISTHELFAYQCAIANMCLHEQVLYVLRGKVT